MASVRDAFFNKIYELVRSGEDIVIVSCDLGAPSLDDFRRDYPERYISVGIAEQNLIAVSAGLALSGKKVVAYGLDPFPITRAFDQVRTLMAELKIPITLCALNAGLCSAECGYTHMPIEDMGMMRMLSNIQIVNPSDEMIARGIAGETVKTGRPRYIRFDKSITGCIYGPDEIDLERGFSVYGRSGSLGIITNGCFVRYLRDIVREYERKSINIQLIDLYSLPVCKRELIEAIKNCSQILTIEENVLDGGLGSLILEILSDYGMYIPVKRLGLDLQKGYYDVFTDREYIRKDQQLDAESLTGIIDRLTDGVRQDET